MQTRREFIESMGMMGAVVLPAISRSAPGGVPRQAAQAGAATVAVVKGREVSDMVAEALRLIGGLDGIIRDGDRVVIKPNLTNYSSPKDIGSGMTTDVRVVQALVEQIQRHARCKITFAEGSGLPADVVFAAYGYTKLAKQLGIDLVDLAKDNRVPVKIEGLGANEYQVPRTTLQCDVLINVPVLKTHQLTGVSMGMKNLFGLFPVPRQSFHALVDEHLCDIAGMKRTDLIVIDGLTAMEGQGPLRGTPVRMDLIMASRDMVAADAVGTAIMGHDPKYLKKLQYASGKGLGESRLDKITVLGVPISKVRRDFKPAMYTAVYTHPQSDEALKKLRSVITYPGVGYTIKPETAKLDPTKYPVLSSHTFFATLDDRSKTIQFIVPCEAIVRLAVVEELKNWLS